MRGRAGAIAAGCPCDLACGVLSATIEERIKEVVAAHFPLSAYSRTGYQMPVQAAWSRLVFQVAVTSNMDVN